MKKGFTLIEILVVVAILAMLSAIATNNFLEAQVRSKISKTKVDMRSLSLAIEAHAVDNNHYPIGYPGPSLEMLIKWGTQSLSTPIAYVQDSYPLDPFMISKDDRIWTGSGGSYYIMSRRDTSYQYFNLGDKGWLLSSLGPDKDSDIPPIFVHDNQNDYLHSINNINSQFYDPTNGTTSSGDIFKGRMLSEF